MPAIEAVRDALTAKGVAEYELFHARSTSEGLCFINGRFERMASSMDENLALRLKMGGRLGAMMSSHESEPPESLVEGALAAAGYAEEAGFDFAPAGKGNWPPAEPAGNAAPDWPLEKQLAVAQEALALVNEGAPKGLKASVSASAGNRTVRMLTSAGFEGSYGRRTFVLSLRVNGFLESGFVYLFENDTRLWPDFDPRVFSARLLAKLEPLRKAVPVRSGRMRAIFTPDAVASMLYFLQEGLSGRNVLKGSSPLKGRLGQAVLSPRLTLHDDPLRPDFATGYPFDDEGIPAAARAVFDKGVLKTHLTDLYSAAKLGCAPTGHAHRASLGRGQPSPGFSCVVVDPGAKTLAELVKDTPCGLLIGSEVGIANPLAGEFSCAVGVGMLIENGEVRGRVKDTMIAGNIYDILGGNVEASSERERAYGAHLLPHLAVEGVSVSS